MKHGQEDSETDKDWWLGVGNWVQKLRRKKGMIFIPRHEDFCLFLPLTLQKQFNPCHVSRFSEVKYWMVYLNKKKKGKNKRVV